MLDKFNIPHCLTQGEQVAADVAEVIAHSPVDGAAESAEFRHAWKRYQRQRRAERRATMLPVRVVQLAPRQSARQRARRSTTKRLATSSKSASDGPEPPQRTAPLPSSLPFNNHAVAGAL